MIDYSQLPNRFLNTSLRAIHFVSNAMRVSIDVGGGFVSYYCIFGLQYNNGVKRYGFWLLLHSKSADDEYRAKLMSYGELIFATLAYHNRYEHLSLPEKWESLFSC